MPVDPLDTASAYFTDDEKTALDVNAVLFFSTSFP
jgi:hypothetical protein